MNLSSIGDTSSSTIFQWQNQKLQNGSSGAASSSRKLRNAYGSSNDMSRQLSSMVELTKNAMNAMGLESESRVTFNQINKYRDQLNSAFSEAVKEGLSDINDASFTLKVDDVTGGLVIESADSTVKAAAQEFFDNNPELVKQFKQIEALSGLDNARTAMQISPAEMRRRIEIESLASWWAGMGDSDNVFGSYANESLSILSGLNLNV